MWCFVEKYKQKIDHQIGVGDVKLSDNEKQNVMEVLNNNRLSYGPFSMRFESQFAKLHNAKHAVFCNSGTSALQVALAVLKEEGGWQDNDEVIVPSVTFIATSNVVLQNNMKPVFVDVLQETYNLDPSKIEEKITSKTKAIIVVHLFGLPCDMDPIIKLAKKYHLKIIEDSCETMFATYKGKSVGTLGDIACFSTYTCHVLVTGVGGLIVTNNDKYAVISRSMINHGRDSIYLKIDDDNGKKGEELKMIMNRRFSFIRMGYSYRATEMEAALGCGQLERHGELIAKRRRQGQLLTEGLKKWKKYLQLPTIPEGCTHSFMMYPLLVTDQDLDKEALTFFLEENNIETRYLMPLLCQPYYKQLFGQDIEDQYPVAKKINKNGFYISSSPDLKEEEIVYIIAKFDEFFTEHEKNMHVH